MKVKYAILAVVLGLLLLGLWLPQRPSRAAARLFLGTTNIVITDTDPHDTEWYAALRSTNHSFTLTNVAPVHFTVSNPTKIQQLLDTLQLRGKDPCACGPHYFEATFHKAEGPVRVSFCNHCFDLYTSPTNGAPSECLNYHVPPRFFAVFRELVTAEIGMQR